MTEANNRGEVGGGGGLLLWALIHGTWLANRRSAGHHRLGQQIEFAPREA
ncbi:hypothetical protein [Streptomyces sp. NPDC050528]